MKNFMFALTILTMGIYACQSEEIGNSENELIESNKRSSESEGPSFITDITALEDKLMMPDLLSNEEPYFSKIMAIRSNYNYNEDTEVKIAFIHVGEYIVPVRIPEPVFPEGIIGGNSSWCTCMDDNPGNLDCISTLPPSLPFCDDMCLDCNLGSIGVSNPVYHINKMIIVNNDGIISVIEGGSDSN